MRMTFLNILVIAVVAGGLGIVVGWEADRSYVQSHFMQMLSQSSDNPIIKNMTPERMAQWNASDTTRHAKEAQQAQTDADNLAKSRQHLADVLAGR